MTYLFLPRTRPKIRSLATHPIDRPCTGDHDRRYLGNEPAGGEIQPRES